MNGCPSEEQLARLAEGMCADEEAASIGSHIDECPDCSRWIAEARANEDALMNVLNLIDDEDEESSGIRYPITVPPSNFIEGYEIIRELHRGGQGVVYQAMQKSTNRKVAIKVLLEGPFASQTARSRFVREIELVANLNHPNIVTVFDSGRTSDSHLFCVMDYVRGRRLNEHVRENTLPLEEVLKLFVTVCEAVMYAHKCGVIHRDLKPSNILIGNDGHAKILDFGLAKMVGGPDNTMVSLTGQVLGTLPYMSPEQAKGETEEIDARTDVYALGIILYELLTGHYPYPVAGTVAEVSRHVIETDPIPPSRRWSADLGVPSSTTGRRGGGDNPIDAELQTLLLKSLTKDPRRRYQSVGELVSEIRRYQAGEPIHASGDSIWYVLSKRVRRHKRSVSLVASLILVIATTIGLAHSYEVRQKADQKVSQAKDRIHDLPKEQGKRWQILQLTLEMLNGAIKIRPDSADAYHTRAQVYVLLGMEAALTKKDTYLDKALKDWSRAMAILKGSGDRTTVIGPEEDSRRTVSRSASVMAASSLLSAGRLEDAQKWLGKIKEWKTKRDWASALPPIPGLYRLEQDRLVESTDRLNQSPKAARMSPDTGATLRRAVRGDVVELNPLGVPQIPDREIIELLYEWFYRIELVEPGTLQPKPNPVLIDVNHIARLENDRVWEIPLHEGVTWHDGEPVTADDVELSWRLRSDNNDTSIDHMEVVDPYLLRVAFDEVAAAPEWEFGFPVVPRHIYEQLGTVVDLENGQPPVGCGPYRWADEQPEHIIILDRWDQFAGEHPLIKRMEFHICPSSEQRLTGIANGEYHLVELTGGEFRWAANGESFDDVIWKIVAPKWCYEYICWNTRNDLFSRADVRRAITMSMNLDEIINARFGGVYRRSTGINVKDSWMFNREIKPLPYDPQDAAELLDGAGWSEVDPDTSIRVRNNVPFEFTLVIEEHSRDFPIAAHELQANLKAVGIEMKIDLVPKQEWDRRLELKDFDAIAVRVNASLHPQEEAARWTKGGAKNYGGYYNRRVDSLYDRARRETDPDQRRHRYGEIQKLVYEDQPYTFLWEVPTLLAISRNAHGVVCGPHGAAGHHPGARSWWIASR